MFFFTSPTRTQGARNRRRERFGSVLQARVRSAKLGWPLMITWTSLLVKEAILTNPPKGRANLNMCILPLNFYYLLYLVLRNVYFLTICHRGGICKLIGKVLELINRLILMLSIIHVTVWLGTRVIYRLFKNM